MEEEGYCHVQADVPGMKKYGKGTLTPQSQKKLLFPFKMGNVTQSVTHDIMFHVN